MPAGEVIFPWYTCTACRQKVSSGHEHDCAATPAPVSAEQLAARIARLESQLAHLQAQAA